MALYLGKVAFYGTGETKHSPPRNGYNYELKILGKGGNARAYGNIDSNGKLLFDSFEKSH